MLYWHYDADIVSFALLLVVLFDFRRFYDKNKLQDRIFRYCTISGLICVFLEGFSGILTEGFTYPLLFLQIVFFIYYVTIALPSTLWFCYVISVVETDLHHAHRNMILACIPPVIWIAYATINLFTGSIYYFDANNAYTHGPLFGSQVALYAFFAACFLGYVIVKRNHFPAGQMVMLAIILPGIVLVGMLLQIAFDGWQTMYAGYALAILITYLFIQNRHTFETVSHLSLEAVTDKMTGLLNRDGVMRAIQKELDSKERKNAVFAILDLDGLKYINDTFGHPQGDRAIMNMAHVLTSSFRKGDIAGRIGGDEFVFFLPSISSENDIAPKLTQLTDRLSSPGVGPHDEFSLHASIGAVFVPVDAKVDFDWMYHRADLALYDVKRGGKSAYRFYRHGMGRAYSEVDG